MIQRFIKDGKIKSVEVNNGKVITTIELNGFNVINPSLDDFLSIGWQEYYSPEPVAYIPTLEELVQQKIREKYTLNKELQIQRKRDVEPDQFQEYYNYVEECISWAKDQPHRTTQM